MSDPMTRELVQQLENVHAVEQFMAKALDSLISASPDYPELQEPLREHRQATGRHLARLDERLVAAGVGKPKLKDGALTAVAMGKSLIDKARTDNAANTARDGYVAVHLAIASYELLRRAAERAGQQEIRAVAQENLADERAMAQILDHSWDLAYDVRLKQKGLEGAPAFTPPSSMVENAQGHDTQPPPPSHP